MRRRLMGMRKWEVEVDKIAPQFIKEKKLQNFPPDFVEKSSSDVACYC